MTEKEKIRRLRSKIGYWQEVAVGVRQAAVPALLLAAYKRGRKDAQARILEEQNARSGVSIL